MQKPVALAILFILVFFQSGLAADDLEQLVVSKDKTKWQFGARAAMAPNGNVLVVWCEETNPSITNFRVVVVLCKLGANGKYSAGTPIQITTGLNSYFSTSVAYHPGRNKWAVVWSEQRGSLGSGGIDIYGAVLNANGTMTDGPKEIWSNPPAEYVSSHLYHIKKGLNAGRYLMLYTIRTFSTTSEYAAVGQAILKEDLTFSTRPLAFYTIKVESDIQNPFFPGQVTDIEQNSNGEFLIGVSSMDQDTLVVGGLLFRLNNNAQRIGMTRIDSAGDIFPIRIVRMNSKGLFLTSFWTGNTDTISFWNRRYLGNLKPKGKAYQLLPDREELLGDIVKLNKNKGAYSVVVSQGQIWGQYVRKSGKVKVKDEPEMILEGAGKASDTFQALCIPGTNRIFLLWQHKFSSDKREVRALIFNAR